ncbi:MAG: ABC transporter ATP-binding protein, partial [Myxococcales bacterium]|nr:ABC transporter ATP-binding protein [Myxococcales bacterium]
MAARKRESPHGRNLGGAPEDSALDLRAFFGVFRYSRRAIGLVWTTSRKLTILLALLTLVAGVIPAFTAYVGRWIVDAVVDAAASTHDPWQALRWVIIEAGLVVVLVGVQRGISICQSLLRALLGNRVNVMILEKALTLDLIHFEDSEFYDK